MNDVRIEQNSFTSGIISPNLQGRKDLKKYANGCARITNFYVKVYGGLFSRNGTKMIDQLDEGGRLIPFTYASDDAYVFLFMAGVIRIYRNKELLVDDAGDPVTITTPFAEDDLFKVSYTQIADVMFLAHINHPPAKIVRNGEFDWTYEELVFVPKVDPPVNIVLEATGFGTEPAVKTIEYVVSTIGEDGEESLPSETASVIIPRVWIVDAEIKVTWDPVPDAKRYNIYKASRGYFGFVSTVEELEFIDDNEAGDVGDGPKEENNPFEDGNHPSVVGIYQQRLYFMGTAESPQSIYGSQLGFYNDFSISYPLKDTDSIEAQADVRQIEEIRHFFPFKNVLVLSAGSEIMLSAGRNSDSLTPSSTVFENQSGWGTSSVEPILMGDSLIIVQSSGKTVRDLYYSLTDGGYIGGELSVLAPSVFDAEVIDWAHQRSPSHLVYCVKSNGKALAFTYLREQEVFAWAEWETQGSYKSTTTIPNNPDVDAYFLVEREGKFYVEVQDENLHTDCSVIYEGEPTKLIGGLEHLAGISVQAVGDGSVFVGLTVSDAGVLELPEACSHVVVGLGYTCEMETLDPSLSSPGNSVEGFNKNLCRVTFRVLDSFPFQTGATTDTMYTGKSDAPPAWAEAPKEYSGFVKATIARNNRQTASFVVRQDLPLPLNIIDAVSEIEVGRR